MKRETKRAQHRILFWVKKREVSLVITQTDREEDKGRDAAVLSKVEAAGKRPQRSLIHSTATLIHIMNTWRSCTSQTAQVGLPDLKDIMTVRTICQYNTCCCWTPTCLTLQPALALVSMYITLSSRAFLSAASTETCLPWSREGRGRGVECGVEGNTKKFKMTWREQSRKGNKKSKAKKKGRTEIRSNHRK